MTAGEPATDMLIFMPAAPPGERVTTVLSGRIAPTIENDRDRAVLRALLTLALRRLDTLEHTPDAHL
jgi:hypothetical protein